MDMTIERHIIRPALIAACLATMSAGPIFAALAMPNAYSILTQRSIFRRGVSTSQSVYRPRPVPEDVVVFNGATQTDGRIEGFLEDSDAGTETIVQVGDRVASGRISNITLNELDYTRGGNQTVHVKIGENLNGKNVWYATTLPAGNAGGVDSDVLARLRARRLKEIHGGG
jgi:hypothetical protein